MSNSQGHFDIIILGAGISGLLLASELSKELSVLVLEKEESIPQNKYWLTDKNCVHQSPELTNCIDEKYDSMDFISYDNVKYSCKGDYLLWDTGKLIKFLVNNIESNNSTIITDVRFYSYITTQIDIIVKANDMQYSAKLLIDCMGFSSPIVNSKGIIDIKGYYLMYGKIMKLKKKINPIGLYNILLEKTSSYLEVFPTKNNEAYTSIISSSRYIPSNSNIKSNFDFIINKSHISSYFDHENDNGKFTGGIIPIGRLRKRFLNRIFFFGESGQYTPATSATGLTVMLYCYKYVAHKLKNIVMENKFNDLRKLKNPYLNHLSRNFQLNLFNDVLNWNSDQFGKFVNQMSYLDNKLVYNIIFGRLDIKEIISQKQILKIIRKDNYLVKNLLKSFIN